MKSTFVLLGFTITAFIGGYNVASFNNDRPPPSSPPSTTIEKNTLPKHAKRIMDDKNQTSIKQFHHELSNAQKQIAKLKNLNENLSNQIEQSGLPIPNSVTYPDLVEKIEKLPLPLIDEQLGHLFDDDGLQQIGETREFAKRLLEVALTDNDEENTQQTSIIFSTSPLQGSRLLESNAEINKFDTIFAHIATSESRAMVLVKWQRVASGELMLLTNRAINNNGREQYVLLRPKKGWQKGQYKVSVHTMDNKMTILGSNQYTITKVVEADKPKEDNDPVLQDLIESGQAAKKVMVN